MTKTEKRKLGDLGEDVACKYLESKGFVVVERNFLKKWGEIDIVAQKGEVTHFIEVKSVSREKLHVGESSAEHDFYRPEENVHPKKLQRLQRVIQSYILEKGMEDKAWQFHVISVFLNTKKRIARCRMLEDIVL